MNRLQCPICGSFTAFTPVFLTKDEVFDYVLGINEEASRGGVIRAEFPHFFTGVKYAIIYCQACEGCFVAKETSRQGWHVVYPILNKTVASEIPNPMSDEFKEASLCFAVGAYRACAAMCQRTLESLCQDKKVSGLNQLKADGVISPMLFDQATEIRLWAGIIKHKPLTESVSKDDAEQLLTYLEMILNRVYVEPMHLESLKLKRQSLDKKE